MEPKEVELNSTGTHFNLNQLCRNLGCKPQRLLISKAFNERLVEIAVKQASLGRYVSYKDLVKTSKGRKSVTFVHLDFLSLCQGFSKSRKVKLVKKSRKAIGDTLPDAPPNSPDDFELEDLPEMDIVQPWGVPQPSALPPIRSNPPQPLIPLSTRNTSDRLPQKVYPTIKFPWQK